jgi:hypothetical protein
MLFLIGINKIISMKQQEVFNKIGGIIREINEQYQYLQSSGEIYNDLELELMVANAHFLSDHIAILRKVNTQTTPVKPTEDTTNAAEIKPDFIFFEPVKAEGPEESSFELPGTVEANVVEFEIGSKAEQEIEHFPEPETIRHELTMEDIGGDWEDEDDIDTEPVQTEFVNAEPISKPEISQPKQSTEPVLSASPHHQIIIEDEQILTFNQRMSAQMTASRMSDQLSGTPITDLKTAITLNDKLLYIKDLFHGYSLAYSEAIDILNRFKTFEEAENFLKTSYATKNNWADKQATVDKLYALLQRRYV